MNDLFDMTGQAVVVTGGSRGLGLQIAEALGGAGRAAGAGGAQAGRAGRGRRASGGAGDRGQPRGRRPVPARGGRAHRRHGDEGGGTHRRAGEQRGRDMGRAGRGSPDGGLAARGGREPDGHVRADAGGGQAGDDSGRLRPRAERRLHRGLARQPRGDERHAGLQHDQGRRDQFHPGAGGGVGRVWDHGERAGAGLLPQQR